MQRYEFFIHATTQKKSHRSHGSPLKFDLVCFIQYLAQDGQIVRGHDIGSRIDYSHIGRKH